MKKLRKATQKACKTIIGFQMKTCRKNSLKYKQIFATLAADKNWARAQRSSKTCEICIKLFQSLGFGKHLGNCLYGDGEAQLLKGSIVDGNFVGGTFFWVSQSIDAKSISSRLEGLVVGHCALCILMLSKTVPKSRFIPTMFFFTSHQMGEFELFSEKKNIIYFVL